MRELSAGLDEAGRGCLAGPVCAAAVILPPDFMLQGLNDSKQVTATHRQRLALEIRERALAWAVGWGSVAEIEELNILRASLLAMQRAAVALGTRPTRAQVDGIHAPSLSMPVETVVDGDAKIPSIMAASILAKVARDAEMQRLDAVYPGYGFARHKGYGTVAHLSALRTLGPCELHRRGFAPVRELCRALESEA